MCAVRPLPRLTTSSVIQAVLTRCQGYDEPVICLETFAGLPKTTERMMEFFCGLTVAGMAA